MKFDNRLLKGKIKEKFDSESALAKEIKMAGATLSLKLRNKSQFTRVEIAKIAAILEIDKEEVWKYFFVESDE